MTIGIINRAIKEANKSTCHPYKVGAVVFKNNRIISSGHNQIRHNSINNKYKKYKEALHAEQDAVLGLDWNNIKGCSILVVRLNYNGNISMGKPCDMCTNMIKYIGIKKMYYSNYNGEIVLEKL